MGRPKRATGINVGDPNGTDGRIDGSSTGDGGYPVETFPTGDTGDTGTGAGIGADSGAATRRRGRPPGSATKTQKPPDLGITTGALLGIHELAAMFLKCPELELDEMEAEKLAKALMNLQRYYPAVDLPGVAIAWIGLLSAGGQVYGPRIGAYRLRVKHEKESKVNRPVPIAATR